MLRLEARTQANAATRRRQRARQCRQCTASDTPLALRTQARYDAGTSTHPRTPMLINCVAYQNGKKLADIPIEDISEYVSQPDCFVWVALFEPSMEELDVMAQEFNLHELAVDDARHGHQRPKIEEYGDSLFAVLHTIEREQGPDGS